jgi:beta-phosphoglucomutase-like phosphatase (HAD superfamily)
LKKLEEIRARKKREIHKLEEEIDIIGGALSTVEQIKKNQTIAETLSSAVKKQKI